MDAITAALQQIDDVGKDGDLEAPGLEEITLDVDAVQDPICLPDGKRILPPSVHGEPVHELACKLLDIQSPAGSRRLVGQPSTAHVAPPPTTPAARARSNDGARRLGEPAPA